jgi:putative transposase
MPRPPRLNLPGIPQHVTQRGNNRQACFFDDEDRIAYLSLLGKAAHVRGCEIHAYVLMTNHVHLLVTPTTPDGVSRLMQDIGREYVRRINGLYRRSGTLWEGRFKSSLVDSERYGLICYRYIELNPVRAKMVGHPGDYRWSSFAANALGQTDPLLTPHPMWLALGKTNRRRCNAYRELFMNDMLQSKLEAIRYSNRKGLPLGSEAFKAQVEARLKIKLKTGKVGRPAQSK